MPTTATVAPAPMVTPKDVAIGLRAVADLVEQHGWLVTAAPHPSVRKQIVISVATADDVRAMAMHLASDVQVTEEGGYVHTRTTHDFDGVTLTVFAIAEPTRILRRDPEATAVLAERDA